MELQGKTLAGAFAVGDGAVEACTKVIRQCDKVEKKLVAYAGSLIPSDTFRSPTSTVKFLGSMMLQLGQRALLSSYTGVRTKFIVAEDICEPDNVASRLVFRDFLPRSLASRQLVPAPEPLVIGKGLEKIQEGMELQKKGVSAQKIVVSL